MDAVFSRVRVATAEDEPEIMRLLELNWIENGMGSINHDCVRRVCRLAFERKGGIIGVMGGGKTIHAMIGLLITKFWFHDDDHIEEIFSWVHPDHRKDSKAKYAETLITFAKRCSDEIKDANGRPLPLVIGVLTNKRMAGK